MTRIHDNLIFNNADKDMVLLAIDNTNDMWESYSRSLWATAVKTLPSNAVIWDVGSYNAYYSMMARSIRSDIFVFAFEPHPNNIKNIKQNLISNNMDRDIELFEAALVGDDKTTTIALHITNDINMPSGSSIIESTSRKTQRIVEVEAMCGDYVKLKPNLIKIDVEGAEYNVLIGMKNILQDVKPIILFEMLEEDSRVISLLTECGYTLSRINEMQKTFAEPYSATDRNYLRVIES